MREKSHIFNIFFVESLCFLEDIAVVLCLWNDEKSAQWPRIDADDLFIRQTAQLVETDILYTLCFAHSTEDWQINIEETIVSRYTFHEILSEANTFWIVVFVVITLKLLIKCQYKTLIIHFLNIAMNMNFSKLHIFICFS